MRTVNYIFKSLLDIIELNKPILFSNTLQSPILFDIMATFEFKSSIHPLYKMWWPKTGDV